jgi:hypothetical protein
MQQIFRPILGLTEPAATRTHVLLHIVSLITVKIGPLVLSGGFVAYGR